MKNLIYVVIIVFTIGCKAQSNIINITDRCNHAPLPERNGSLYLKDVNNLYTPFVGVWKWTQGNKELTITLIKQTKYHYNKGYDNYYEDRIVGYYIYKENNVILINTSNDDLNDESYMSVKFGLNCYSDLTGKIKDISKNKYYRGWFELLSPTKIKFHGKEDTHIRKQKEGYPTLPPVYVGNTFPLEMVLVKQ